MRFLLDQSAETRIGTFLIDHGHDVTRIARDYPAGLPDAQVLAIAHARCPIVESASSGKIEPSGQPQPLMPGSPYSSPQVERITAPVKIEMIEKEIAKFENPLIARGSSCA